MFSGKRPINVFFPDTELEKGILRRLNHAPRTQETRSVCPAEIEPALEQRLRKLSLRVYQILECRDWCRMEFRLDGEGNPMFLELNPIAGIAPGFWFPRSAAAAGMDHPALINKILDTALQRYQGSC